MLGSIRFGARGNVDTQKWTLASHPKRCGTIACSVLRVKELQDSARLDLTRACVLFEDHNGGCMHFGIYRLDGWRQGADHRRCQEVAMSAEVRCRWTAFRGTSEGPPWLGRECTWDPMRRADALISESEHPGTVHHLQRYPKSSEERYHLCALRLVLVTACEDVKLLFTESRFSQNSSWKHIAPITQHIVNWRSVENKYLITKRMDLEIARGSVQLFNTNVRFPANNRHRSRGPWDMGDRHCEHEIAQGINPDITQAVLSTTDAFRKGPRYVFALMPRNLGEGTNTAVTTATSVWVKPLSEAKTFHDTIATFFRFIAAQTATSPLEEIEELKAGNCHCSTLLLVNRWTSLVPRVRQCWMCTTSVQDDALCSHQIVKGGTGRLKSCGTISAPWSPSFSRSQGSQKNEASSMFKTTGNCCLHRICLPLNQQHTLHNNRSIKVQDGFRFHVGIFDRDDRLIHPILCCTDGAVRSQTQPMEVLLEQRVTTRATKRTAETQLTPNSVEGYSGGLRNFDGHQDKQTNVMSAIETAKKRILSRKQLMRTVAKMTDYYTGWRVAWPNQAHYGTKERTWSTGIFWSDLTCQEKWGYWRHTRAHEDASTQQMWSVSMEVNTNGTACLQAHPHWKCSACWWQKQPVTVTVTQNTVIAKSTQSLTSQLHYFKQTSKKRRARSHCRAVVDQSYAESCSFVGRSFCTIKFSWKLVGTQWRWSQMCTRKLRVWAMTTMRVCVCTGTISWWSRGSMCFKTWKRCRSTSTWVESLDVVRALMPSRETSPVLDSCWFHVESESQACAWFDRVGCVGAVASCSTVTGYSCNDKHNEKRTGWVALGTSQSRSRWIGRSLHTASAE